MSEKLAIDGGPKAVTTELPGWPQFDERAIEAVGEVLRSGKVNYWTGPKGMEFEEKFAAWQGSKYAISVSSGTAALRSTAIIRRVSITAAMSMPIGHRVVQASHDAQSQIARDCRVASSCPS